MDTSAPARKLRGFFCAGRRIPIDPRRAVRVGETVAVLEPSRRHRAANGACRAAVDSLAAIPWLWLPKPAKDVWPSAGEFGPLSKVIHALQQSVQITDPVHEYLRTPDWSGAMRKPRV